MFLIGFYMLACMFFGFLGAAVLNAVFRQGLRFRADWTSTFIASMLTCLVTGVVFCCAGLAFRDDHDSGTMKVLGTTFAIAFVTGVLAFRLIVKSESGRSLSLLRSVVVSLSLSLPPLVLVSLVSMLAADY